MAIADAAANVARKMQPTKELIDELDWERVQKARQMSPADKLLSGFELFDLTTNIMADGIRSQYANADEHHAQQILRDRLALIRRLEENA